ncbi:hypothetical protein N7462_002999 [Penicillium macrosclerotiorum]|uniref:uncharacterized protein n=1 Tax=Penicillium macrosclerotiorum TaxID=303699 RepID=UPI002546E2A2|nr:uncharacterized protein N7462_002999 [Penicillium macrosclerotiorum]KAJ5688607.1 hypothetical protein N7462_002999 [Penicillium macrosclerotiorum]
MAAAVKWGQPIKGINVRYLLVLRLSAAETWKRNERHYVESFILAKGVQRLGISRFTREEFWWYSFVIGLVVALIQRNWNVNAH